MYELYDGSLKAFHARFSTTITTPGVLVVIWELATRSERSKRSCEQLHSHLAAIAAEGSKEWFHDHTPVVRPTDELKTITHIARHHTVMGQSPDRRADHLSRRRDRYGAAASVIDRRGERPTRLRIGTSGRVCAGGGREFGHPRAHTVPCGGGTVT